MPVKTEYQHGQFSWIDLMAKDMDAAKSFYQAIFGWEAQDQDTHGGPPYAIFTLGDHKVAGLGQMDDQMRDSGMPSMWNSYINVDDVQAVADKAESLGGKVSVPPMQVVDAGWLTFLQDATGAHVAFWQKNQHHGAELIGEPGSLGWNELITRDVEQARKFYNGLLGWEYEKNPQAPIQYYFIMNAGKQNGGMLQMDKNFGDMPSHWMAYLRCADVTAAVDKLKTLGGQVHVPPFDIPIGKISIVADPDGGTFTLMQLDQEPPKG